MTLVSEKFLTIEKLKVLIFFVVVIYSVYSCEECNYMFSNYASCTGESVCVYGAEYMYEWNAGYETSDPIHL